MSDLAKQAIDNVIGKPCRVTIKTSDAEIGFDLDEDQRLSDALREVASYLDDTGKRLLFSTEPVIQKGSE